MGGKLPPPLPTHKNGKEGIKMGKGKGEEKGKRRKGKREEIKKRSEKERKEKERKKEKGKKERKGNEMGKMEGLYNYEKENDMRKNKENREQ